MCPKVGVLIVNWNGYQITRECIISCGRLTYSNKEIFLIDNGSIDDSFDKLKKEFPSVIFLHNKINKGFSGGVNPGIQAALKSNCSYIWLLNNDAQPAPECLSAMVDKSESNKQQSIVGSVIHKGTSKNKNPEIEVVGGGRINFITGRTTINKNIYNPLLGYVSGASMLIPASLIKDIGYFDERYFMYYEDADFCLRAKKNGISLVVAEKSHVWHVGSASTKGIINPVKDGYAAKSCVIFFKKHGRLSCLPAVFAMSIRSVRRILYGDFKCVLAIFKGLMQGVFTHL